MTRSRDQLVIVSCAVVGAVLLIGGAAVWTRIDNPAPTRTVAALGEPSSSTTPPPGSAAPSTSSAPSTTVPPLAPSVAAGPTAAPPSIPGSTSRSAGGPPATLVAPSPAQEPAEGRANPALVARRFSENYWSWRWDEPDGAQRSRCRPWDSDRFDAEWAQSSSAAADVAARRARHEVRRLDVSAVEVDPEEPSRWRVRGRIVTTADAQPEQARDLDANLLLLNKTGGWRVDYVADYG